MGVNLSVKPLHNSEEDEIEITNLEEDSTLEVQPMETFVRRFPASSYEALYDGVSFEDFEDCSTMSPADIVSRLGDSFETTPDVPQFIASFDDLYFQSGGDTEETHQLSKIGDQTLTRWSAPVGTVEPPILEEEEFISRFDAVREKTESHWSELETIISTENLKKETLTTMETKNSLEDPKHKGATTRN